MSISEKQLLANRKNALNSTGPKSASGKLAASKNSLTHGLRSQQIVVEGEVQEEFDDFRDLLIARMAPADPLETLLVDRIAASSWRLRRTGHIEAQIFDEMRNSLSNRRKLNPNDSFVEILENDEIGFPSRSRFETFQEAKSAWDATEDGIACAEGRMADDQYSHDSFSRFLKDSRSPEPELPESQHGNIVDAISDMKKKYEDKPDFHSRLSELQDTFRSRPQHLRPVHIPAFRQYLQDLRELFRTSDNFTDKQYSDFDDAIDEISHLEMAINRHLRPNLGQALSCDLKGPDVLSKFTRYEAQIQGSLFKAMHELQRLQASRHGQQVPPPVALDIDISGDFPP